MLVRRRDGDIFFAKMGVREPSDNDERDDDYGNEHRTALAHIRMNESHWLC